MPLTAPTQVNESWFRNTMLPFINTIEGNVTSLLSRMTAAETAVGQKYTKPAAGAELDLLSTAARASLVTGGATRIAGGAFHLWSNPAVDPGANAANGDLWVGDVA